MKKFAGLILLICCLSFSAAAEDREVLEQAYQLVLDNYIDKVELSKIFSPSVKSLTKIDKNINVVLEGNSVTVYYKGKIHKVYSRPDDDFDASKWAKFTAYLLEETKKLSPELQRKDFELVELMLYHGIQGFDKNSHYYPVLEVGQNQEKILGYSSSLLPDDILYIRLGTINDYTQKSLLQTLQKEQVVKGIVLDLRGNGGGYLKQALEIADEFLSEGILIRTIGKSAGKRKIYRAHPGEMYKNVPMVVLVDGKTASAAEVIALALKDERRAKLVGAQTYGKGTVQNIYQLDNGAYMGLTTERIFGARGVSIDETGIRPGVCSEIFGTDSDIDELLEYPYNFVCPKLSRHSSFDLDVALRILKQNVEK